MVAGIQFPFRHVVAALAVSAVAVGAGAARAQLPVGEAVPGASAGELRPDIRTSPRASREDGAVPDEDSAAPTEIEPDSTLTFRLNGVNLTGATVYETAAFEEILADFVGTDVTLGGLREIGNRIERKYRDDGYVATRVIIPPQAIRDGVPTLEIYEGKIIHYEINGEIGDVKKLIARYLDNLLTDKPARWSELERYLLLARDLPGISLTGTLRSAGDSTPGGVILVVDAARKPVDAFINMQNRNADATGPWTASTGLSANSGTEYGERLGIVGLAAVQPFEQMSAYLVYEHAIGDEGLRLKISNTLGFAAPRDALKPLKLETETSIFSFSAEYPVVRSRRFSMWTRGGIEVADQRGAAAEVALFDDQMRNLFLGAQAIWFPPLRGTTTFDIELRKGLDHFGASKFNDGNNADRRSRPDAAFDYTILKGSVSHAQPIPPFFELFVEFSGQLSDKPLPSLEEWALGELSVGRGYEPGSITGDSGYGFIVETRFTPPSVDAWWLDNLQVYAFLDYGRAYDRGQPTGEPYEDLMSAGFGTRFQVFETFFGDVYLAIPRTKALSTSSRKPHPTVNFSITKFF